MRRERDIPLLDRLIEGSLLAFAACLPISVALSQLTLALLLVAWIALRLAGGRVLRRTPGYLEIAILCLLAGGVIACLVNRVPGQLAEVIDNHAVLLALPVLAVLATQRPVIYRRAIIVAATVGAIVAIYGIWQHFAGVDLLRGTLLIAQGNVFISQGTFGHHLTYGGSMMLALVAALGLAHTGRSFRLLPAALLLPLALAVVWSYARSAWVGTLAGTTMLVVFGSLHGSVRRLLVVGTAVVVVVAGFVLGDSSVRSHIKHTLVFAQEPPPRVRIWQGTAQMLREHPLGIGPGRFATVFPEYQPPGNYDSTVHAHSDMLRALTDAGPVGLAAYLLLVPGGAVLAWRRLWRRRIGSATEGSRWRGGRAHRLAARRDLLAIAVAGSTAMFAAGLMQPYFWDLEDLMLWMLLVAPAMASTYEPPTAAPAPVPRATEA